MKFGFDVLPINYGFPVHSHLVAHSLHRTILPQSVHITIFRVILKPRCLTVESLGAHC